MAGSTSKTNIPGQVTGSANNIGKKDTPGKTDVADKLRSLATGVAIVVIVVCIGYAGYLMLNAPGATDQWWNRNLTFLPMAEALVFASAGFLYGREVHRERAESAEKRADENSQKRGAAEAKYETANSNGKKMKRDLTGIQNLVYSFVGSRGNTLIKPEDIQIKTLSHDGVPTGTFVQGTIDNTKLLEDRLDKLISDANEYFPD